MRALSSFNCGVKYLLCVIDVFTKYAWIKPLNDEKAKTVLHGFIEIVNESIKSVASDYSTLTKEIKTNLQAPKFKVGDKVRITKYKNNFSEGYAKNLSREIFVIDSVLKTNPWT